MPIYEYQCDKCGEFEVTQRITDEPLKKCPTCRSKVKKLISSTSFQLKGGGWYITDYGRSGKSGASSKGESKSDAASESKSDSKGETKSDSKADSSASTKSSTPSKSNDKAAA